MFATVHNRNGNGAAALACLDITIDGKTAINQALLSSGIDKMRERRSQAPFEFLQAHFKILTF
jgi:hypothetical protein